MLPVIHILRAPPGHVAAAIDSLSAEERGVLLEQARGHGLGGVLLHECGGTSWGATDFGLSVRREALSTAAGAMRSRALLVRTLGALNEAGITPTPLKGVALSARLYGDPLMRATSDVDLLVRPEELPTAEAVLQRMGLALYGGPSVGYSRTHHHHVNYVGSGGMVELHFRAIAAFDSHISTELFLEQSRPGEFDGYAIRVPDPTRELLHLAVHAAQHLLGRLGWLYDLKLLLLRSAVDWKLFVRFAQQTRLTVPTYVALRAAREAAAAPVPQDVLDALAPGFLHRRVLDSLFSGDRLVERSFVAEKLHPVLQKMLLCSSAAQMARFFAHHASRAAKRRIALRLPQLTPAQWRG